MKKLTILISCPDQVGLVTNITRVLASHQLNIVAMREFVDEENKAFFTRIACTGDLEETEKLRVKLLENLPNAADVNLITEQEKQVAVLVTKEYHCLSEILIKNQFKTLGANVQCVIGNYEILRNFTEMLGIPYFHISHENKEKEQFESEIKEIINQFDIDYLVLAKFMRILSADFVKDYAGKIINIHHSFLPAFIGANPYRRAFERGVKIIGATAHFVTNNLDEGPIITQHTTHIDHNFGVKEMIRAGKEIEKKVLLDALELIFEDRVFVSGNKTIVFK
ncbi:formyltetrahydrofolate deformylase [Pedobacter psychrotolerans]|uniref:Formyltetrahydrofolate deformylase n=1 Tax=Pedobacter psychrotolerans TaxID=1843235 RepID=A0A4R2HJ14_9SPHI|nr:formyltetrahydrofolate deformylase [Pedobacter psychrotolerans]TCO26973.1 formyltetrahydrofolate deformylase [Pedobacter psychrotolerans]GGE57966.1 formyltetrahydrofolate deformylase [Pedobacter psychrotolerans]